MKICNGIPAAACVPCEVDYKAAVLSIPVMKEDCKDEIVFIKRLIREKRLINIDCIWIRSFEICQPEYEITVTYRSRDDKQRTLIF